MSRKDQQSVAHPPSWPPTGQSAGLSQFPDSFVINVPCGWKLTSCFSVDFTASGDRVGHGRVGPQLAPDAPALRDGRRQEALLLDD